MPCHNLAQSGVTSQTQETAGETLRLALVVFICASFRMVVGLVGETLQQFAAWRLLLRYLFFSWPIRPRKHSLPLGSCYATLGQVYRAAVSPFPRSVSSFLPLSCPLDSPGALRPPHAAWGVAVVPPDHHRPPRNLPPCRTEPKALFAPASGAAPELSPSLGHLAVSLPPLWASPPPCTQIALPASFDSLILYGLWLTNKMSFLL